MNILLYGAMSPDVDSIDFCFSVENRNADYYKFSMTARPIKAQDHWVLLPARLSNSYVSSSSSLNECLREDIAALCRCDALYLMPSWTLSENAKILHELADKVKIPVTYIE